MMSSKHIVLFVFSLLLPVSVTAQPYLGPYRPDVYGPGINSDATGRPFTWQPSPGYGSADPLSPVRPDVFGPGTGADQYGRPVQPVPYPNDGSGIQPGAVLPQGRVPHQGGNNFGAIAFSQTSGRVGYSYDYAASDDAARSAVNSCGQDCSVVLWFGNACGALAVGSGRGYGSGWAGNQADAENIAMNNCSANTSNCQIAQWVCTSR